jgi:hypothetical protein
MTVHCARVIFLLQSVAGPFQRIRDHAHDNKVRLILHLIILDIGLPSLNGIEARLQDQIGLEGPHR